MILLEVAGGIVLAGIALTYWRQLVMALIALTMAASVALAVVQAVGK